MPSSTKLPDTTPIAHDIEDDHINDVPQASDMHVTSSPNNSRDLLTTETDRLGGGQRLRQPSS